VLYSTYIRASPHGSVTSDAKNLANLLRFHENIGREILTEQIVHPWSKCRALLVQEPIHLHDIGIAFSDGGKHPFPV